MDSVFYVETDPQMGNVYILHRFSCYEPPRFDKRFHLGRHTDCKNAVKHARQLYSTVTGCSRCCPEAKDRNFEISAVSVDAKPSLEGTENRASH